MSTTHIIAPEGNTVSALRPDILFPLFASVTTLPGVGEKTKTALERLAGSCVRDLIWHFPSTIIDRRFMPALDSAPNNTVITTKIRITEHLPPPPSRFKKSGKPYRVTGSNDTGQITLIFFKAYPDYIEKQLPLGEERVVSGRVERSYGVLQMAHPDYIAPISQLSSIEKVEPVYPLTYGMTQKPLMKTIQHALRRVPVLSEWIDLPLIEKQGWPRWHEAIKQLHTPSSSHDIMPDNAARKRLAYDELLAYQLALQLTRKRSHSKPGISIAGDGNLCKHLRAELGFTLTQGQEDVISEIKRDQAALSRMTRLLQGDVGSGKTVVALCAMLNAVECGKQTALMAPTEILARQHMVWIQKVTAPLGLTVALLTGKNTAKERKTILEALAHGEIDIIIGTHALFQQDVLFKALALVVIDEQHRFGVNQRMALANKGEAVDMLLMTATPIPRTLTMTLYGDMDVSRLTDKPAGRQPIDTRIISLTKSDSVIAALQRALEKGDKIYWICPLIEESEDIDLAAAKARYEEFLNHFGSTVGLVHGKMTSEERDAAMMDFKESRKQILIATTVVEVGVDVPDASIMVIEHAERFGLSQLHQLRGRVGRGDKPSTCMLLYDPKTTGEVGRSRLKIMRESDDGFLIAEEDLRLRGGGDILGTKQSGLPSFKIADLEYHADLLPIAHKDAQVILEKDNSLTTERGKAIRHLLYLFDHDQSLKHI